MNQLDDDEEFCSVDRTLPAPDECNHLFLYIIRQAIDDFRQLRNKEKEELKEAFLTASGFMFDPEYTISWGESEITFEQICDHLELNAEWVRKKAMEQIKIKLDKTGVVVPANPKDLK